MTHSKGTMTTDCAEHDAPYQNVTLRVGSRKVATVWIDDAPVPEFNAEQDANARRLVACWNACEGVPTDALEQIEGFGKAAMPYHQLKTKYEKLTQAVAWVTSNPGAHPNNVRAVLDAASSEPTDQQVSFDLALLLEPVVSAVIPASLLRVIQAGLEQLGKERPDLGLSRRDIHATRVWVENVTARAGVRVANMTAQATIPVSSVPVTVTVPPKD